MCAGARFTYLPGRTRRRAAASRPRSQRRRARRRRPREPSGQQTRRPRVRSRQHAQGDGRDGGTRRARLACSKTLCRPPSAAESWFRGPSGRDSNEIASRRGGRCFAVCSPIRGTVTCRGYTWRASGALITPESSPAAPSRPAPYAWDPRSRDGGGAARPPGPGVTLARASAESGRPLASLTSQTAGSPSRWTILQLCHSMDSFSLFRLETVEKLEDLNFKMSSAFYYPQNQSGSAT